MKKGLGVIVIALGCHSGLFAQSTGFAGVLVGISHAFSRRAIRDRSQFRGRLRL